MKTVVDYLKRWRTADAGPGSSAEEYKGVYFAYLYGAWVPFLFLFLKMFKVQILPVAWAYNLMLSISVVAPVIRQHWAILVRQDRIADAANYSLFVAISILMCLIPIFVLVRVHLQKWRTMLSPHPMGLVLVPFFFLLNYLLMVKGVDFASDAPKSIYQLYFDKIGLYYFRQYVMIWLSSIGPLFLSIMAVGFANVLTRRFIE